MKFLIKKRLDFKDKVLGFDNVYLGSNIKVLIWLMDYINKKCLNYTVIDVVVELGLELVLKLSMVIIHKQFIPL